MEADRDRLVFLVWYKCQPVHNLRHTLEVVAGCHVGNTIFVHDLSATKLQIGRVDLTAEELVDSSCSSQDDRLAFDLDSSLA